MSAEPLVLTEGGAYPPRSVLLRVMFDGAAFAGFQKQQDGIRSVAGVVEEAWLAMLGEVVIARATSRTDAGVHARRLPILIRTHKNVGARGLMLGLNVILPEDCKIVSAEELPVEADVRSDAVGKRYVYYVQTGPARLPLWRTRAWYIKAQLDPQKLLAACQMLEGIHDFAAFRSVNCSAQSTSRNILQVRPQVIDECGAQKVWAITVEGNAFLHNMVRIMAGTVVDIARGRKTLDQLAHALKSGERTSAGQTAPPHALVLDDVFFGPWGARQGQNYKDLLKNMAEIRDGVPESAQ